MKKIESKQVSKEKWEISSNIPKEEIYDSRTIDYYKYRAFDKRI
jgi:hypothetical protein